MKHFKIKSSKFVKKPNNEIINFLLEINLLLMDLLILKSRIMKYLINFLLEISLLLDCIALYTVQCCWMVFYENKYSFTLYPTLTTIYDTYWFAYCIIAPVESASPDLKNLLLQNSIISPSILLLYSTVLLNKRSAIYCAWWPN